MCRPIHPRWNVLPGVLGFLLWAAGATQASEPANTITLVNNSGEPALVKLVGSTPQTVEVPDGQSRTVPVASGEYSLLARYGAAQGHYTYSRGDPFTVTQTATEYSAITITLHKVVGGNYQTEPASKAEFERAAGRETPPGTPSEPQHAARGVPGRTPFTTGAVLAVPGISEDVGEGEIAFGPRDDPGRLKVTVDGVAQVFGREYCFACFKTLKLAPNQRVAASWFQRSASTPGPYVTHEVSFNRLEFDAPRSSKSDTFLVAGPKGATLRKEGAGFRLVEGQAELLRTAAPEME